MDQPTHEDTKPNKAVGWSAFRWVILGIALALTPAILVEALFNDKLTFWEGVTQAPKATNDATRALRFEGDLHIAQRNFGQLPERSKVLIIGNSVIAWNIHHGTVRACCGPNSTVAKTATTRLTMLETAMLSPTIIGMGPDLVVLSMSRWDAAGTDGWSGLRWYEPGVAQRMSQDGDFITHHASHLSGLLQHHFLLFRHRQALLQHWGQSAGLPVGDMLSLSGGKTWTNQEITSVSLPTVETRALRDLAQSFRAAGIRLLVVSGPTLKLTEPTTSDGYDPVTDNIQQQLETHLQEMARKDGFAFLPHDAFTDFHPGLFQDTIHMNRQGAVQFSRQLGSYIDQLLKSPDATWPQSVP